MKKWLLLGGVLGLCWWSGLGSVVKAQAQTISPESAGEHAFEVEDWSQVVELYSSITKTTPLDGGAWYRLGRGLEELGKYPEAITAFQKADDLKFQPALTRVRLAASYAGAGNTSMALVELDQLAASGFPLRQVIDREPHFATMRQDPHFVEVLNQIDINGSPCKDPKIPEYRQMDFWVGDWDVFDAHNNKVASDSVELTLKSCVLSETWTDTFGAGGRSFSRYNAPMKQWEQYWVDEGPTRMFLTGHFSNGAMRLETEGFTHSGVPIKRRVTFSSKDDKTVRQFAEVSRDGGKTYQTEYDLTYRKKDVS